MKRIIPIVLILIFVLSLCSCGGIDYVFDQTSDQIESLSILNVWLDENGDLREQNIKTLTDNEIISEFIVDLSSIKCKGIGEDESVGLLENDEKSTVFKLKYKNGDIEYINYFGQASKVGGTLDYSATQGTFERVDFNALLNKYIQN